MSAGNLVATDQRDETTRIINVRSIRDDSSFNFFVRAVAFA